MNTTQNLLFNAPVFVMVVYYICVKIEHVPCSNQQLRSSFTFFSLFLVSCSFLLLFFETKGQYGSWPCALCLWFLLKYFSHSIGETICTLTTCTILKARGIHVSILLTVGMLLGRLSVHKEQDFFFMKCWDAEKEMEPANLMAVSLYKIKLIAKEKKNHNRTGQAPEMSSLGSIIENTLNLDITYLFFQINHTIVCLLSSFLFLTPHTPTPTHSLSHTLHPQLLAAHPKGSLQGGLHLGRWWWWLNLQYWPHLDLESSRPMRKPPLAMNDHAENIKYGEGFPKRNVTPSVLKPAQGDTKFLSQSEMMPESCSYRIQNAKLSQRGNIYTLHHNNTVAAFLKLTQVFLFFLKNSQYFGMVSFCLFLPSFFWPRRNHPFFKVVITHEFPALELILQKSPRKLMLHYADCTVTVKNNLPMQTGFILFQKFIFQGNLTEATHCAYPKTLLLGFAGLELEYNLHSISEKLVPIHSIHTRPKVKAMCTHCLARYKGTPLYLTRQAFKVPGSLCFTVQTAECDSCCMSTAGNCKSFFFSVLSLLIFVNTLKLFQKFIFQGCLIEATHCAYPKTVLLLKNYLNNERQRERERVLQDQNWSTIYIQSLKTFFQFILFNNKTNVASVYKRWPLLTHGWIFIYSPQYKLCSISPSMTIFLLELYSVLLKASFKDWRKSAQVLAKFLEISVATFLYSCLESSVIVYKRSIDALIQSQHIDSTCQIHWILQDDTSSFTVLEQGILCLRSMDSPILYWSIVHLTAHNTFVHHEYTINTNLVSENSIQSQPNSKFIQIMIEKGLLTHEKKNGRTQMAFCGARCDHTMGLFEASIMKVHHKNPEPKSCFVHPSGRLENPLKLPYLSPAFLPDQVTVPATFSCHLSHPTHTTPFVGITSSYNLCIPSGTGLISVNLLIVKGFCVSGAWAHPSCTGQSLGLSVGITNLPCRADIIGSCCFKHTHTHTTSPTKISQRKSGRDPPSKTENEIQTQTSIQHSSFFYEKKKKKKKKSYPQKKKEKKRNRTQAHSHAHHQLSKAHKQTYIQNTRTTITFYYHSRIYIYMYIYMSFFRAEEGGMNRKKGRRKNKVKQNDESKRVNEEEEKTRSPQKKNRFIAL
ncbi:hypothetical protein VP01_621g2 [Puccinia sorghi]|uniref:Uncharacterized protein n=1 Tax=Puccinia sorghi TaxID=27349 RepID=A0A0L6UIN0_9BASI|nr:hypothetical protein VP01_621g2 [Puccinia sorghi]